MNRCAGHRFVFISALWLCSGCQFIATLPGFDSSATPEPSPGVTTDAGKSDKGKSDKAIAIETTTVEFGTINPPLTYTGTTAPAQDVTLKAEVTGTLVEMAVNVGDAVQPGKYLAQLDDKLLNAQVREEQARLASLEAELIETETEFSESKARLEQAKVEQSQTQLDNQRVQSLGEEGAIAQQEVDLAQTTLNSAQTVVQAAEEQVQSRQAAVSAAQQRVEAQKEILRQTKTQQANTIFTAPIQGKVLEKFVEPGSTIQVGDRLLRLGNFNTLTITLQISELDIATIRVGQTVSVTLDAFPESTFAGRITQISPEADPISRLIPIEITLPNTNTQIGSGLLARVAIAPSSIETIVIPKSSLTIGQEPEELDSDNGKTQSLARVFVVIKDEDDSTQATVTERTVELGEESDRLVEITSGLKIGDQIVARSHQPLVDGQVVRLSILSQ